MASSGRGWVLLLAFAAIASLPVGASAQSVAEGRRLYLEAEFDQARAEFEGVLQRPSLTRDEAVEAHAHLAALLTVLRESDQAAAHAEAAVALDPAASPPAGAQSSVTALFDEARDRTGGARARLVVAPDSEIAPGEDATFRLELSPAPALLASQLRLRCVSGSASADERGEPPEVSVSLSVAGDEVSCRGGAHTRGGAALLDVSEDFSPSGTSGGAVLGGDATADDDDGGGSALPWILVGAGVLVAAAVVVAVVLLTSSGGDTATLGGPQIEGW